MDRIMGSFNLDEFFDFCSHNDYRYELVDGHLLLLAAASDRHELVVANLIGELRNYLKDKSCNVLGSNAGLQTAPNSYRLPDLLVKCDKGKTVKLVVEVFSKSNSVADMCQKFSEYARIAIPEYWIVDSDSGIVDVFSLDDSSYSQRNTFIGDSILKSSLFPDLSIPLSKIFRDVDNYSNTV